MVPDCESHTPVLLQVFLSSDPSICSSVAFPPLGSSDHVAISTDLFSNSKGDALFYCSTYDYSSANWNGLCDHLRNFSMGETFARFAAADNDDDDDELCE